ADAEAQADAVGDEAHAPTVAPAVDQAAPTAPATAQARTPPRARVRPRAAPTPQPRAERAPGTLTVATPGGWGMVYLGSRQLGEAPGVFRLPAGRHTISIAPFGRSERVRRTVVVPADGTARISVPLGS